MLLIKSMDRLALKLIDIHWIHHLWIRKQEERHTTPEDPHVMNVVMRRKEISVLIKLHDSNPDHQAH